jgi:5-methyltetrahydrofolate--homocysteine methyltransferase
MSIAFTPERWDRVRKTYGLWWEGTLERPILPVVLQGRDPGRKKPELPLLSQANSADLSVPAKDIIDRIDYELSQNVYLGDSFPYFNMDCFGPGVAAAFLGAEVDNSTGRVWFHPKEQLPITELHFEYDPDNVWLNRVKEIYFEGMKRWQGQVLMGMTDLGGTMDILSTFRPSENLLLDLYDYPEEVKRLIGEISGLWKRLYQELNEVLQPINPGYSDWSQIYSCKPSYILQCDFSYMISPAMFDEFVKPELADMCRFLGNSFYHLDGVGQIPHLDSILAIKELNGVQWVPGDGKPTQSHWPDLYRRIQAAGKNSQLWEGFDGLETLISILGSSKGIHHTAIRGTIADEAEMRMKLSRYGAE